MIGDEPINEDDIDITDWSYQTELTLHFDGACEPVNPGGTAAYGFTISNDRGNLYEGYGVEAEGNGATNNVAEWAALKHGLTVLVESNFRGALHIKGDSQLVINQLTGKYKCNKSHLMVLRDHCWKQVELMEKWDATWIPREQNSKADQLSRQAIAYHREDQKAEWQYRN